MAGKIYFWGTGRLAGKILDRWIPIERIEAFIDNNPNKKEYFSKKVLTPEDLIDKEYDAVIVCTLGSKEIYNQAKKIGLDLDKFIFLYGNCCLKDINEDYSFVEQIVGEKYAKVIEKRYHVVRGTEAYGVLCFENTKYLSDSYMETDYVRIKTFELVVKEIRKKDIKGEVAEAGVFRGEFAQYINKAFPDRKLYLFDTFDGFDVNEAVSEKKNGNCTEAFIEAYKDTNIMSVLEKMDNLDQIVVKQGFFPASAEGINDSFAFVSLDMDFEESIYEGIKYFYPKMSEGGYIFIHDYNSSLLGVEKAVDRYEIETGRGLKKVPIPDANGTLVISK
ncbi:Macrocin-O-methyltransferase (TylF) [Pseudobutyrivibrio sp. ACV-2]|uniref:TylF/MycF/NovP-related O-methyltransferase n=1 Tax=Pseudobutyrivibrio sp. ACV-2 TaxID=1520801 RepID=UPI00089D0EB6|nr:TylF/MycF/NovP-related O-methyltransferase [Pseudobutyrivibrio sp. ACV-2]SEA10875.1 Macrocin-O-methyltransferase (TylF) [Pseudobutyrivibrio sp. ACV-2]